MFALLKYQHNISSWCWLRLNYFSRTKPKTQTQQPFGVNIWQLLSANTTTGHAQADTRTWAHLSCARKVVTCCKFRKFSGRLRWQKLICSMAERSHKQRADDSCENRDRSAHSASAGLQRSRGIILQPVWDLQSHSSLGEAWGGNASRQGFRNTKEEKLDVWFLLSNMREEVSLWFGASSKLCSSRRWQSHLLCCTCLHTSVTFTQQRRDCWRCHLVLESPYSLSDTHNTFCLYCVRKSTGWIIRSARPFDCLLTDSLSKRWMGALGSVGFYGESMKLWGCTHKKIIFFFTWQLWHNMRKKIVPEIQTPERSSFFSSDWSLLKTSCRDQGRGGGEGVEGVWGGAWQWDKRWVWSKAKTSEWSPCPAEVTA